MLSEVARQQARAEGLTLLVAENKTGFLGVYLKPNRIKPYQAQLKRGGKDVILGSFATAEEAALCVARTPEGRAAVAERAATAAPPLTSEEALGQAQAEGLTLLVADNKTGYYGVSLVTKPRTCCRRSRRCKIWDVPFSVKTLLSSIPQLYPTIWEN